LGRDARRRWDATNCFAWRFTGQREDATIGLYFYNARYYDPKLGRFIQADTIVPDPGNPQLLNRYSYVGNRPVNFIDPSGYDPLDAAWEAAFRAAHGGQDPTDRDRQDRLFSLIYSGSGLGGSWTESDWQEYVTERDEYYTGAQRWKTAVTPGGIYRFAYHVGRLAAQYDDIEQTLFVRGFALLFAGVPYDLPFAEAAWYVRHGPDNPETNPEGLFELWEGPYGWNAELADDQNPSHHYAGFVFLGYYVGVPASNGVNLLRDYDNTPDMRLGNIGAAHGVALRDPHLRSNLAALIVHVLSGPPFPE
jgi:RHS repeat-associated protein